MGAGGFNIEQPAPLLMVGGAGLATGLPPGLQLFLGAGFFTAGFVATGFGLRCGGRFCCRLGGCRCGCGWHHRCWLHSHYCFLQELLRLLVSCFQRSGLSRPEAFVRIYGGSARQPSRRRWSSAFQLNFQVWWLPVFAAAFLRRVVRVFVGGMAFASAGFRAVEPASVWPQPLPASSCCWHRPSQSRCCSSRSLVCRLTGSTIAALKSWRRFPPNKTLRQSKQAITRQLQLIFADTPLEDARSPDPSLGHRQHRGLQCRQLKVADIAQHLQAADRALHIFSTGLLISTIAPPKVFLFGPG